jgi:transposase
VGGEPREPVLLGVAVPAPVPKRPSVEVWRPRLEALFDKGLTARAAFDRLRLETSDAEQPFRGSYSGVKRLFRELRRARGHGAQRVAIPVDTNPGECAQVDMGYAGKLYDPASGVLRRAWCFVMVLCHSRVQFVRIVFDQRIETWISLHEQAFAAFGGCVATVVPDNCRRAVLRTAFGVDGACELNRSYRELARHYGVVLDPAPPYSPRKKGKAEAAVKFLINDN